MTTLETINTFLIYVPILYPLKMPENHFVVFSGGYKMGKLARNGIKLDSEKF